MTEYPLRVRVLMAAHAAREVGDGVERRTVTACRTPVYSDDPLPGDDPITCEECQVSLFLADVREAITKRHADQLSTPVMLTIGFDARRKLQRSRLWHERLGGAAAGEPTRLFGIPIAEPWTLPSEGWYLLDGDGRTIVSGEL